MKKFTNFIHSLEKELDKLPGMDAHLKMAPITRLQELKNLCHTDEPKKSAVLILFFNENGKTKLVFIRRPVDTSVHSGQIAFPGGKYEEGDKELVNTALRETWEEIGVDPKTINVIGPISKLYIPPSNFDVFPFVGYTKERPDFITNEEVDKLLEFDLDTLLNPDTFTTREIKTRFGKLVDVPCYYIDNNIIWGATAMIVSELIDIIKQTNSYS